MTDLDVALARLHSIEMSLAQFHEDSRTIVHHGAKIQALESDIEEIKQDVSAIRSAQGRNFIVSLIAACSSIGAVVGILSTLGGPG